MRNFWFKNSFLSNMYTHYSHMHYFSSIYVLLRIIYTFDNIIGSLISMLLLVLFHHLVAHMNNLHGLRTFVYTFKSHKKERKKLYSNVVSFKPKILKPNMVWLTYLYVGKEGKHSSHNARKNNNFSSLHFICDFKVLTKTLQTLYMKKSGNSGGQKMYEVNAIFWRLTKSFSFTQ